MSIAARVITYIQYSGDVNAERVFDSGALPNSPGDEELTTLAIGDNVIVIPAVAGFTYHGVAIIPPDGNTEDITLKGNILDVGIMLSVSKVSVIHFDATPASSLVLTTAVAIPGVRLIWF